MSAKPALRGLLKNQLKKDFTIAAVLAFATTASWQLLVKGPRKSHYTEFYKIYDAEQDFERMKAAGVFTAVKPDGSVGEGW